VISSRNFGHCKVQNCILVLHFTLRQRGRQKLLIGALKLISGASSLTSLRTGLDSLGLSIGTILISIVQLKSPLTRLHMAEPLPLSPLTSPKLLGCRP